ncbi:uncharacterized protein KY384_002090 [Bacidia gigantensis]|uniref:uncharacterized protein n=1 Tax=Bacidia gigantensis TaxID=2732470 RepID=UPI001D03FA9F|nr:uncharacterized protein KY384_002090 [Bacidia gigantensis]KAG8533307.1 hypothetical protein KY384_002090 [Bacidia gigantensis]
MDDSFDDLFGDDAAPLQVPIPISQALVVRLSELCETGCCQKAAWSKSGVIAYIPAGGQGIILQHLLCDPRNGQWGLSKQYPLSDAAITQSAVEIVHLSWEGSREFLAVIDARGRTSIYNSVFSVNRLRLIRNYTLDPADDLSSIVGLMWIQYERLSVREQVLCSQSFANIRQAVSLQAADPERWEMAVIDDSTKVLWPKTPTPPACLGNRNKGWCYEGPPSREGWPVGGHTRELRIYRIRIDFDRASTSVQHLKILPDFGPPASAERTSESMTNGITNQARLTFLELIPAGPDFTSKERPPPQILAAFSFPRRNKTPRQQTSFRQVLNLQEKISSSSSGLQVEYCLKGKSVVEVSKALLSLQHVNISTILALSYSDGHIEFRDSQSFEVLPPDGEDRIFGLGQVGFAFPATKSCMLYPLLLENVVDANLSNTGLVSVLSPNSCASFSMDENHFPEVLFMQYIDPGIGLEDNEATLAIINEAFVMQLSTASRSVYAEDILATLQLFSLGDQLSMGAGPSITNFTGFNRALVSGIYRGLGVSLDAALGPQPDQSIKNMYVQRCLSLQAALGFQGVHVLRPVEGLVALVMLHLKHVGLALLYGCNQKTNGAGNELKTPEMVAYLVPMAKWFLSLISFITDEILSLRNDFEDCGIPPNHIDANLINQKVQQSQSPALLLLYQSTSRAILQYCLRYAQLLATEGEQHGVSTTLGRYFLEFKQSRRKSPVDLQHFEIILVHVETSIKASYQQSNISESDRKKAEEQMLIKAEIPSVLVPSVLQLLYQVMTPLREEIDEAKLHFLDTSDLGLTSDNYTRDRNAKSPIDVLTKVCLPKNAHIRRCIRCGSLNEDRMKAGTNASTIQTAIIARLGPFCFCGGLLMLLDNDDKQALSSGRL